MTSQLGKLDSETSSTKEPDSGLALILALVARSLQSSGASGAEAAFEILAKHRQESELGLYWGDGDILSVQATSLALITYTARGEEYMAERILVWISLRLSKAQISDPVTQALVTEAMQVWKARFMSGSSGGGKASTATSLSVELPSGWKRDFKLHSASCHEVLLGTRHLMKAETVQVSAKGQGTWILQIDFKDGQRRPSVLKPKFPTPLQVQAWFEESFSDILEAKLNLRYSTLYNKID